ncbi:MAG: hypothetical protein CVV25_04645 [Ignavibacteriae bacterium HGW-Ignavibacteriae-4]|jgi:hypothetical protein|nr:MAG: hypothetical protein CVV25_04645 [Ignavibacteriae bacterium HGW-Ignavibacteriae-4]
MSISAKTRKSLWAKSGNRCAICRLELVQDVVESNNLILGEECHIISSKSNGPRGDNKLHCYDYDDYENLLLLCANDHKRVDTLVETYTVEKLIKLKKTHSQWVKTTLSLDPIAFTNDEFKTISLKRIKTGKEIINVIDVVHTFSFENDELIEKEEIELIPPFFDLLKEYVDILDMMSFKQIAHLSLEINSTINTIEEKGFKVFGLRRSAKILNSKKEDMGIWDKATIVIVRNDNPGIVGEHLIMKTPKSFKLKV